MIRQFSKALSFLFLWTLIYASEQQDFDPTHASSSSTIALPAQTTQKSHRRLLPRPSNFLPTQEQELDEPAVAQDFTPTGRSTPQRFKKKKPVAYISLPELLGTIPKPNLRATLLDDDLDPTDLSSCCCFSMTTCGNCYTGINTCSRVSWTIIQGVSSTIASLSHYARRSLIPLVAFGNFNQKTRNYLLTWIAILQTVGETTETIHDYALGKAIQNQKNLKKIEDLRHAEKRRLKLKYIQKCAEQTLPKLRITQAVPLISTDYHALSKLYDPESHQLVSLNQQLKHLTDLTWIEELYYSLSEFFWNNTYPFFWFAEVALSLTQLIIIITDLTQQDEPSLKMSIIMMIIEGLQYFSTSMKRASEEQVYETYKFRKKIKQIAEGSDTSEGEGIPDKTELSPV